MALTDESSSGIPATMLVGPATMGGNMGMPYPVYMGGQQGGGNGGGGWDNGNGWWIILLFILLASGNWGNNGNNGDGGFGGQPIIVNDGGGSSVQRGFDQAAVMTGIGAAQTGIQNLSTQLCNCCCDMQNTVNQGFNSIGTQLCNGFAGVNSNIANGFAQSEIADNARQIANMNQAFAAQTAMAQGFNQLGSQFADCCCENRLGLADLKYTVATENCADRTAAMQNTRDIIDSQNRGTQAILDKLCALELDSAKSQIAAEQRENANLRSELMYARGQASQVEQNAFISQGFANEVDALYNRLNSCPVPTTPVYGRTPIFTCNNNCGCGCGGNNF